MSDHNRAPVDGTAGDLLMIFREGVKQLEHIRDTRPNDSQAVENVVIVMAQAMNDWTEARINYRDGIN